MESTLLIEGVGFPRLSCRGVTQTLMPIQHGELRRSVNGELCYVGAPHHQKYKSTVTCADMALPGLQQFWVGAQVRVQCVSSLWEKFSVQEGQGSRLSRPAVVESLSVLDPEGNALAHDYDDQILTVHGEEDINVLVSYRPVLDMRIQAFDFQDAEWEKGTQWRLDLSEI